MPQHFIREWREHRGLQQREFAEALGVVRPYVSMVENGHRRYDQKFLEGAAAVLNCTPADLVSRPPGQNEEIVALLAAADPADRLRVEIMIRALLSHGGVSNGDSNS